MNVFLFDLCETHTHTHTQQISEKLFLTSIRNRAWTIQPSSAKEITGVKEGIGWAIQAIQDKKTEQKHR